MYLKGQGVEADYAQAMLWYGRAAEQGHAHSQYMLGVMHYGGYGTLGNFVLAHMWVNLSVRAGYHDAEPLRRDIEGQLTPAQLQEAQATARQCAAQGYKGCG